MGLRLLKGEKMGGFDCSLYLKQGLSTLFVIDPQLEVIFLKV